MVTLKDCDTGVAAAQVASPGCEAFMEQPPVVRRVTVLPETVQTVAVFEENTTASPEDAVAETVKGGLARDRLGSGAKLMVCGSLVTWKLWVTAFAAA